LCYRTEQRVVDEDRQLRGIHSFYRRTDILMDKSVVSSCKVIYFCTIFIFVRRFVPNHDLKQIKFIIIIISIYF
jgi:hypothetical protein